MCTEFCENSSTIFEFYSSIKQEVDRVSYLNSAVPYRILNLAGKNSADPLFYPAGGRRPPKKLFTLPEEKTWIKHISIGILFTLLYSRNLVKNESSNRSECCPIQPLRRKCLTESECETEKAKVSAISRCI